MSSSSSSSQHILLIVYDAENNYNRFIELDPSDVSASDIEMLDQAFQYYHASKWQKYWPRDESVQTKHAYAFLKGYSRVYGFFF